MKRLLALALLALPAACATDEASDDAPADDGSVTPRATYYDDVLPIFAQSCMGCHVEGSVGPFAIDDIEQARTWGGAIAASVSARTMPPFGANNDGSCNTFRDASWLSDEEIATIVEWVEDGMAEGEEPEQMPTPPAPTALASADVMSLHTPAGYVPLPETYAGGEHEDYQCFLIDPDFDRDRFVTGFDVVPGNSSVVHHVIAYEVDPAAFGNAAQMQLLDDLSPDQVGWDCLAAAGENVFPDGAPVTWAPGIGATNFPEGTGIRVEAGHVFVVQMHYNLAQAADPGDTIVQVALADEVEREARQTLIDPFLFQSFSGEPPSLPPGEASATYTWEMTVGEATYASGDATIQVMGLLPHMHKRGRRMSIDFDVADQGEICGGDIDRYDFNWQRAYFLETPLTVANGDTLRVTCDWDTRGDTEPVLPGFGTANEMCLLGLYVTFE